MFVVVKVVTWPPLVEWGEEHLLLNRGIEWILLRYQGPWKV